MTRDTHRALSLVTGYIADKGFTVGEFHGAESVLVTKEHCPMAELHYDDVMQTITITLTGHRPRSLFLYHPTILAFLDLLFDPPPPACDPDR